MSGDKTFWAEFLEIYKQSPSLWRIKSSDYSNRIMKAEAYDKLVIKLKEKYPDANRDMVVKKINTFRTTYRKEFKKVQSSEKSGAGMEDIYEPTLWYYHTLSFLEDQEESAPSTCSMDYERQEEISPRTSHRPKKRKLTEEDNLIRLACEHLQSQNNKENINDVDDAIAISWGMQLKEMQPEQKLLARKLISDVLFQGCSGSLKKSHLLQFPNLFQSTPASTFSYVSTPSPVEFTSIPCAPVIHDPQDSIQGYFSNFE